MATPKKSPAKKPAAKKPAAKAVVKSAATGAGVEKRLAELEVRVAELEENNLSARAEEAYTGVIARVKQSYVENPGMTVVAGLGVVIVLLLLLG